MSKITRGENNPVNSCIVTEINLILMLFVSTVNYNNKTIHWNSFSDEYIENSRGIIKNKFF